ncbi:XRE family transcriptional regulator [Streptomyces sp. V2]|uniref:helix-turn-helix domain-containing protein n=1 Tax=Streptomyces sp. V2 TaxID=1424099 RepID=UPI000D66DDEF|nr:helix-turn-helix transcriptional regulator [Streptomyces sp. V2]PWG08801.1 XRE family transcriptional regulator [Streptomyces sp. V2]
MRTVPDDISWITGYLTTVGSRVRAERMRQNLTQERVFLAAGVDRRTLQAIEAGQANPSLATLLRIAYVLDTPLVDLVAGPE